MCTIWKDGFQINIVYLSLPRGSHGNTVLNSDGSFTVFLDPRDSKDMQEYGFEHEFDEHIKHCDFDNIEDKNADELEATAHGLADHSREELCQKRKKSNSQPGNPKRI